MGRQIMQQDYTYAVARIRFRETALLSDADLLSLLSAKDAEAALIISVMLNKRILHIHL